MNFTIKLLLLFMFFSCEKAEGQFEVDSDYNLDYVVLGISFPPITNQEQRNFTTPLLDELNVKHIRISEDWSFREPTLGNFNWDPLDNRIDWAVRNNIKVLLTIQSNGPDWACSTIQNDNSCVYNNNIEFKNYIEQLLQRYSGKIAKIQFGNEWQSNFWYIGNEQQFTTSSNILYNAVQTYSPSTKMVLGGFTSISLRFLAACNGYINSFYDDEGNFYDNDYFINNCNTSEFQDVLNKIQYVIDNALYDEIDIHLYDDVDNWDEYYESFKTMVQKPIIVSEFGGPNMNYELYSEAYQAKRLFQYIKKLDSLQIKEAYYFKLVEGTNNPAHEKSGLIRNSDMGKKEAFEIFKNLTN